MIQAEDVFRAFFGGQKNGMTPAVIKYGELGRGYFYEISCSGVVAKQDLFGVIVLRVEPWTGMVQKQDAMSKMFGTLPVAKNWVGMLKERLSEQTGVK